MHYFQKPQGFDSETAVCATSVLHSSQNIPWKHDKGTFKCKKWSILHILHNVYKFIFPLVNQKHADVRFPALFLRV